MALGETIGYSVRLSQNNGSGGLYEPAYYGSRYVNSGLMGDPTLRLHPVLPPSNLTGGTTSSGLVLSWTGSSDTAIKGYNVYRAATAAGPFTRLNGALLGATTFTDAAPIANGVYMVRAVKLESTPSGTYYNPSQGVFFTNSGQSLPPPANASKFVKTDTTTGGNWKGVYGSEGNWIAGAAPTIPSYGSLTTAAPQWTWSTTTTSGFAPYLPGTTTSRIAACWYSATQLGFDFTFNDTQLHRVSIYLFDATSSGRQERIDLVDRNTGTTLDSRTVNSFASGVYLTWDLTGNVSLRMTPLTVNAVASAIFFDTVPTTGAQSTGARFVATDGATHGNWKGVYGAEGNWVAGASASIPSYANLTASSPQWIWGTLPTSVNAPLLPGTTTNRIAACWYSSTQVGFDLSINDGRYHRLSIYCVDWTSSGRQQRVDVIDRNTGAILDTRNLSAFSTGVYLTWDVTGNIGLRLTPSTVNAVTSSIFFDPTP
jgi:hypothetical protein